MSKSHRFAVIPGDGIGTEVVPDGLRVLDAAALVPASPTDAIDTTGCRYAFFGTVLAAMASGIPLLRACRLASCVSSIAAVGHGAQASYADRARTATYLESMASRDIP